MSMLTAPTRNHDRQFGSLVNAEVTQKKQTSDHLSHLTAFEKVQELYYNGQAWYEKDHTAYPGTDILLASQASYIPPFHVRAISVGEYNYGDSPGADGSIVCYDTPYSLGVLQRLYTGQFWQDHVTKVHLDNRTQTATRIILRG